METINVEFNDQESGLKLVKTINVSDCSTPEEVDARIEEHRKTFNYRLSLGLIKPIQEHTTNQIPPNTKKE